MYNILYSAYYERILHMKKINVAVIGCGTIAKNAHIPSYLANENVNIKYFCDIIPERADEQVALHGGSAVYDYREILNDDELDAVSVCTPNNVHPTITIDFLNKNKKVFVFRQRRLFVAIYRQSDLKTGF